ncbi:MAG: hypothetical protein COA47_00495 [Robiginitomaculum sp.]|nr:MAG: hypothetical protein COA47_00495 [Robiginitomaculum sp.]
MTIKLYHATHTRSLRVLWLLEEMGLEYDLKKVDLKMGDTGGAEYAAINPLQKVPSIEVGGSLMQESTAILEFVATKFGGKELLVAEDHPDYGRFLQWMHGGESGFGMYLSVFFGHTMLLPEKDRNKAMAGLGRRQFAKVVAAIGKRVRSPPLYCSRQVYHCRHFSGLYCLWFELGW